jgi:RNA polymerase sigma-70 factor (ECF subfamily)
MSTETLFRLHSPFVERFLVRLGVPAEHVEDALQDVFLVVHRNGGYRPGVAKPTSYLAGIAINAAHKHRRRQRVDLARHNTNADTESMPSAAPDPTRELQAQEELERLQLALERLPEDLRMTLVLADVEGESCISVAAALGLPVGTVYSRLHVARQKLQLALQVVDAVRARQRARANASRSEPRRAAGWGMLAWLGPLFERTEAGKLLRASREEPRSTGSVEARLARHRELLQAGADLHVEAYAPHAVTPLGLLGPAGIAVVAAGAAVGLVTATFLSAPAPQPIAAVLRTPPSAAAPTSQPSAASPPPSLASVADQASALPAPRLGLSAVAVNEGQSAAGPRPARARSVSVERSARDRARAVATRADDAAMLALVRPADTSVSIPAARATETAASAPAPRAPEPEVIAPIERAKAPPPLPAATPDALIEMQALASAERSIKGEPGRALSIVRDLRIRFPKSYLGEERSYVEVMALFKLGHRQEAIDRGNMFLGNYPDGPYTRRVRRAIVEGLGP